MYFAILRNIKIQNCFTMDNQELNAMLVSCSGASNTGRYADKVAVRLQNREGQI